jgi:hypothetical protein
MAGDPKASDFYPADNPAAIAHINLIEGIINRLANNSASCKTWCLTLVSALLSFAGSAHNAAVMMVALIPIVALGFLDARYLTQEKGYRGLYTEIVGKLRDGSYKLASDAFKAEAPTAKVSCALRSWSIWPMYLGLLALYAACMVAWYFGLLVWPK